MAKELTKAVAYLRTSSKTNVGPDKDCDKRQRAAMTHSPRPGYDLVDAFYDAAVTAQTRSTRPEFAGMLAALWATA